MKKFLISMAALIVAAVVINFSALIMHKNTFVSILEEGKNFAEKNGKEFNYESLSMKSFFMWDMEMELSGIEIKYGDKDNKTQYKTDRLLISFKPFQKTLEIIANDNIEEIKDYLNKKRHYVYESSAPAVLKARFSTSLESVFSKSKEEGAKWIESIEEVYYEDSDAKLFEKIGEDKKVLVASFDGHHVWVVDSSEPDFQKSGIDVIINFGNSVYNSDSEDETIKMLSSLGTTSGNIEFSYTRSGKNKESDKNESNSSDAEALQGDEGAFEKLILKEASLKTDLFGFIVTGQGVNQDSTSFDWNIEISMEEYPKLFNFYGKFMNLLISELDKKHKINEISEDKVQEVIKVFERLPEAKIENNKMSLVFVQKDGDIMLGGVELFALFYNIYSIFDGTSSKQVNIAAPPITN